MAASHRSRGSRSKTGKGRRSSGRKSAQALLRSPAISETSAQHETLSTRIVRERTGAFKQALQAENRQAGAEQTGLDFKAFYAVVKDSFELLDSMLDDLALDPPLACKRGCIYCCYNQVSLTEPEALFLGFHLLETRDAQQLEELHEKARAMVECFKGKTRQEIGMMRHLHPCLFMENGTCSIYPARPLVCRGWNSVNAEMCRHSNQSADALAPIENHPLPRLLAESVQLGLLQGAKDLGLETGYLLTARAVLLLMEGGLEQVLLERTEDWLSGRPFFARINNL